MPNFYYKKKVRIWKRSASTMLLFACLFLLCEGCKKYEEGPALTLRTANSRLEGSWILTGGSWLQSVNDSGYQYVVYTEEFTKDNLYEQSKGWFYSNLTSNYTVNGSWEWLDKKEGIKITTNNGDTSSIVITKLTSTEFFYKDRSGYSYELIKRE